MASRRKASTPCMIRPDHTLVVMDEEAEDLQGSHNMEKSAENNVQDGAMEVESSKQEEPPTEPPDSSDKPSDPPALLDQSEAEPPGTPKPQHPQQGGYECKYCPFSTQNLNAFKEHVDANHPNVILNPLYLCAVCNFNTKKFDSLTEHNEKCHPGESNFKFKRIKLNNQTILEQTIEGCSNNAAIYNAARNGEELGNHGKSATVKFAKPRVMSSDIKRTELQLGNLASELAKKPVTAVNVNGTVIIPDATLKADSPSHIMPSLQRPPNYNQVPKIAVPLNTSKYNPSLDGNLTLISSFNKFPYPTQAELSWLTAASKHPEEQIKVWFTTQRLKQGISWSPEEVEEARKKMFNGTISSAPAQTFTVVASSKLNAHPSTTHSTLTASSAKTTSLLQSLPCQLLGQTSLVLTPVANGSTVTCAPLALTVTSQGVQSLKRPLSSPIIATGTKRPSIIQTIQAPMATARMVSPRLLSFTVDPNKTAKQLSLLRQSYTQCPFPEEEEIYRLIETTGLSRGEIKKWFSEQRLLNIKGAAPPAVLVKAEPPSLSKEGPVTKAVPSHFPLLERVKGKTSEQLTALEESFQRSGRPTEAELDQLARETKLSKTEVDCWFSERRALRDNMEKVLLTLGPRAGPEEKEEPPARLLNGHGCPPDQPAPKPRLSSSPPSPPPSHLPPVPCASFSSPPMLTASSPHPPILSASDSPAVLASSSSSSSSPRPPGLLTSSSPAPISSRSLALLREVFCRTQWPSPEEYSHLEVQTGLGRTDIVRWFKDHRSALKSGQTLDWMEDFQQQTVEHQQEAGQEPNGRNSEKPHDLIQKERILHALSASESAGDAQTVSERSKLSGPNLVQWFTDRLGHSVSDLSRTQTEQTDTSANTADKERWVKVTVAVGEEGDSGVEGERLAADTEIPPLEQPGRVVG